MEIVNPWMLPALLAGVVGTLVACVVFIQRPGAIQNRAVAVFVWLTGVGWAVIYGTATFGYHAHAASYKTSYFAWTIALLAYVWALSTLDTPVGRLLAKKAVRIGYTLGFLALSVIIALTPLIHWRGTAGQLSSVLLFDIAWMVIIAFGIVVALSAWRRSAPGLLRRKNAAFALAFIVHDGAMLLFLGGTWLLATLQITIGRTLGMAILAIPGATVLVFQALLLYGILTTQLFDIDLKIRWGLSRGTVGAVLVAAFFAASEIVAALLTPAVGMVAGILTTAGLMVALAPLRRVADALAGLLVRDATDTPAYRLQRKEMVYQAQLEELMADAVVSVKERRALLRLQETLGLDPAVAARLERDVLDRLVPAVASDRRDPLA